MPALAEIAPARRLAVIVNRGARAAASVAWPRILDALRADGLAADLHFPRSSAETTRIARRAAMDGGTTIVAAGGDGTINTIVAALAGHDVSLAILPLGTANDLARELGLPLDAAAAARRLGARRERRIDLVELNGRPLCTVGGFGLPAACALAVDRLRRSAPWARAAVRRLGTGIYPALAATTILRARARASRLRIVYRDPAGITRRLDTVAAGVFVANQPALAAGLTLPTCSDNADGLFELCIVRPTARLRLLAALLCLKLGRAIPSGVFEVHAATRARIDCDVGQSLFGDGEDLGRARHFDVRLRRRALRVWS